MPLLDEQPPPIEKRSSMMPVIAAVLTIGIAGAGIMLVWKHGAAAAVTSDAAVAPIAPVAVVVDASAPVAPVAAVVDASVAPVPVAPIAPVIVRAGSDDSIATHGPKYVVTSGRHGKDRAVAAGPTTAIDGSGPVTMPEDPMHSAGGSPIFRMSAAMARR